MRANLENLSGRSIWVLSTIHKYLVEHEHLLAVKIDDVFGDVQSMPAVSEIAPTIKELVEGAYLQAEKGGLVFTLKGLIAVGATPSHQPPSLMAVEFLLLIALADKFTRLLEDRYDVPYIDPLAVALELGLTHSSAWVEKAVKNYEASRLLVTSVGKDSGNVPITLVSLTSVAFWLAGLRKRQLLDGRLDFSTQASPRDKDATPEIAAAEVLRPTGSIKSDQVGEGGGQFSIDPFMSQGDLEQIPNSTALSAGTSPLFVSGDVAANSSVTNFIVPASDRFIEINHNSQPFKDAEESVKNVITAVRQSNDLFATEEDRLSVLSELGDLQKLFQQGTLRVGAIQQHTEGSGIIAFLCQKSKEGVVSGAAWDCLKKLGAWIADCLGLG